MTHPYRLKITTSVQRSRHHMKKRPATSVVVPPHDSPRRGESSVSHTKTLISGRAQNQLHPPHIGGGLGGGGCFFASFFAPKKVREMGSGGIPQREVTPRCVCYGIPQWVKNHIFATFSKKVLPSLSQSDNGVLQCRNFAIAFEMQRRVKAAAQHSSSESRLCVHLALHLQMHLGTTRAPVRYRLSKGFS